MKWLPILLLSGGVLLPGCLTLQNQVRTPNPRHTVKELRDQNVVKQQKDYSCGASALATLMRYYFGDNTSEEELLDGLHRGLSEEDRHVKALRGFSLLDLKRVANERGYKAAGFRVTIEQLTQLVAPVLAFVQPMGYKHFTVLRGISGGRVFLADPARGNVRMSVSQFLDEWGGIIFVLGKSNEEDIGEHSLTLEEDPEYPELVRFNAQLDLGMLSRKWTPDYALFNSFFVSPLPAHILASGSPGLPGSASSSGGIPGVLASNVPSALTETPANVVLQNVSFPSSGSSSIIPSQPSPSQTSPTLTTSLTLPGVGTTSTSSTPITTVPSTTSVIQPVTTTLPTVSTVPLSTSVNLSPVLSAPVTAASSTAQPVTALPVVSTVTTQPVATNQPLLSTTVSTAPLSTSVNLAPVSSSPVTAPSTTQPVTTTQPLLSTTVSTAPLSTSVNLEPVLFTSVTTAPSTTQPVAATQPLARTTVSTIPLSTSVNLEPVVSTSGAATPSTTPVTQPTTKPTVSTSVTATTSVIEPVIGTSPTLRSTTPPLPLNAPSPITSIALPPLLRLTP